MPYIPTTKTQETEMLSTLGVSSIEDLFCEIPATHRFPKLHLNGGGPEGGPQGLSEMEVLREAAKLAEQNADAARYKWFLGAGSYKHFIPAAVNTLSSRGEFLTAYTPYQPEVSQGTLQAIFEYQSMICDLTGMDVSNAGHYDGATALAESVLVALRAGEGAKRNRVLVPESLHPEYRQVLETYLAPRAPVIETYDSSKPGFEASGDGLACVVAAYPDFFGSIPAALLDGQDAGSFADAVHAQGGLLIVHTDPIMLGLFKNPASFGADMVTAEGQCLGNDMNFGGPGLGIMAVKESLMRRIPGRIVGEAFDAQNRRGFVLTLAAREQHIRREKAASNICSNEGLAMLRAAIYLALMGKTGLKQTAELCWHKSHYAAKTLAALPGCAVPQLKSDVSFFKEFVLSLPVNAEAASEKMFERGIVMGLPLSRYYPERTHEVLVCVTEENTREDIDAYAAALKEVLEELQ